MIYLICSGSIALHRTSAAALTLLKAFTLFEPLAFFKSFFEAFAGGTVAGSSRACP
jgi:hypothetical protein